MKRVLPFLGIGLLSFGATHLALAARGAVTRPAERRVQAVPADSATGRAAAPSACRSVRVVYVGAVRASGEACAARP